MPPKCLKYRRRPTWHPGGSYVFQPLTTWSDQGHDQIIRVQVDTASTCNTLPENLALSLIFPVRKIKDYLTPSRVTLFTYDNSKLTPMGKLELLAETTTGYHLLTFHVLRDSQIQGKPPLLSGPDCGNLGLVKIRADEVHSVGSPLSADKNQKPHTEASTPLPTADNSHARDMPMHSEPTSSPRMFDVPHSNTTPPARPTQ